MEKIIYPHNGHEKYFSQDSFDDSKEIHIISEVSYSVIGVLGAVCPSHAEATKSTVCAQGQMGPVGLLVVFAFPSLQQLQKRFS